jgi:hypothetical protein
MAAFVSFSRRVLSAAPGLFLATPILQRRPLPVTHTHLGVLNALTRVQLYPFAAHLLLYAMTVRRRHALVVFT